MVRKPNQRPDRRKFLMCGSGLAAAALTAGFPACLAAQELPMIDVASAGSIRFMLEGPLRTAAAQALHFDMRTHAGGADAIARAIVTGSLHPDVFISITTDPIYTVMQAGKIKKARPIARTELVLVYSPKSRFAPQFEAAAGGKANWWEILQQPGVRIGRGDPASDPGARCILFAMMLAAKKYKQPKLVEQVLGSTLNPAQIVPDVQAKLQSGALDATTSYKVGTGWNHLPFVGLPEDINLASPSVGEDNPEISLLIGGKTFRPQPLVFYAGLLQGAANSEKASAFLDWLKGPEAQSLLRQHLYRPPGDAAELHA